MAERIPFRTASSTSEQLVVAGRVRVHAVIPELTTTGTLTLRDGAVADASGATIVVCAIGLTQVGKDLRGAVFTKGLTIQQSVGTDICTVIYERF
jgi:hypothetical protein